MNALSTLPYNLHPRVASVIEALPSSPDPKRTTPKYAFLDTRQVILDMADLGYQVRQAHKTSPFGRHEVHFESIDQGPMTVGSETARVIFSNSYDGTFKAQVSTGIFRMVCSNGLVVPSGSLGQAYKFLHVGDYVTDLLQSVKESASQALRVFEKLETYKTFTDFEDIAFAEKAIEIRGGAIITPEQALIARRPEDNGQDLWSVFNRVQENLIRGGLAAKTAGGKSTKTRALTNINSSNKVNQALWTLMEETIEA